MGLPKEILSEIKKLLLLTNEVDRLRRSQEQTRKSIANIIRRLEDKADDNFRRLEDKTDDKFRRLEDKTDEIFKRLVTVESDVRHLNDLINADMKSRKSTSYAMALAQYPQLRDEILERLRSEITYDPDHKARLLIPGEGDGDNKKNRLLPPDR
jgi:hypothetical protein